jgi:hypothetical protein
MEWVSIQQGGPTLVQKNIYGCWVSIEVSIQQGGPTLEQVFFSGEFITSPLLIILLTLLYASL